MTPLFKLVIVIITIAVVGILFAGNANSQEVEEPVSEPLPEIVYTVEDFEQCSLVLKAQKRVTALMEPFGSELDNLLGEINILQGELDLKSENIAVLFKQIEEATASGDWAAEEQSIRDHNALVEEGNIVATHARYLSQLHQVIQQGLHNRTEMYNNLNTEYLSSCVHEWPPAIVDTACLVDAPTTFDFCEKF